MGALQGQEGNWCLPSPARTSRLIRCRVSPPPLQLPFLSLTRPQGPWPTEETEKPKGGRKERPWDPPGRHNHPIGLPALEPGFSRSASAHSGGAQGPRVRPGAAKGA